MREYLPAREEYLKIVAMAVIWAAGLLFITNGDLTSIFMSDETVAVQLENIPNSIDASMTITDETVAWFIVCLLGFLAFVSVTMLAWVVFVEPDQSGKVTFVFTLALLVLGGLCVSGLFLIGLFS